MIFNLQKENKNKTQKIRIIFVYINIHLHIKFRRDTQTLIFVRSLTLLNTHSLL